MAFRRLRFYDVDSMIALQQLVPEITMRYLSRVFSAFALFISLPAMAQQVLVPVQVQPAVAPVRVNPYLQYAPPPAMGVPMFYPYAMPAQAQPAAPRKPYTMRPAIAQETKRQMMQMMMPMMTGMMRMSMPDAMNWFAYKIKAKPGLKFDEVVESMMLRANQLNFKYVGSNLMYKDFQAVLGDKEAPRIEVHSFCDIAVGRDLLRIAPEFLVFLPCRIGVMEDADKNIWVMMIDWNLDWIAGYENQMGITPELARGAIDIRTKMESIMQAGANGDI
jgi:uncharacterized protein (DUF302 family)